MATPDPRELQRLIKQLNEIQGKITEIGGKPIKVNFEGKTASEVAKEFTSAEEAIKAVKVALRSASGELNNLFDGSSEFFQLTKAIREEFTRLPSGLNATRASFRKINGFAQELTEISADILKYSKEDVAELERKTQLEFDRAQKQIAGLEQELVAQEAVAAAEEKKFLATSFNTEKQTQAALKKVEAEKQFADELRAAVSASKDQVGLAIQAKDSFKDVADRMSDISKKAGIATSAISGLGKAFEKIGFGGLASHFEAGSKAATEYASKATEEGKKPLNTIQSIGVNLTSLFKGSAATIKSAFGAILSPQGLFLGALGMISKAFTHIDKSVSSIGKNLGLSRASAAQMTIEIKKAAAASGDTFLNMDRMLASQTNINNQLGTNVMLTGEQLGDQARLTEFVGLQGEELANVYRSTLLTGQSQEQLYNTVVDTNDSIFASNQLFKEASGVTGQIAMNLGNNPALIAKAVGEAKRLGISLDQARSMADSTLDFESSIAAEMEAQVLTGKNLNLNKARELAFAGDIEGASKEMLRQVGGINEFQNMNVIAQKSLAAAMGLSVDELSSQLVAQAANEKIAARALELQKQGLAPEEARLKALRENQTISERLSNAFAKISDIVGGLVAPLVEGVAQSLEKALTFTETLFGATKGTGSEAGTLSAHVQSAQDAALKMKDNFQGVIDFIKSIGGGLKSAFDSSPILTTLGTIAGGAFAVKGLGKVKNALGFGKLGTGGNPMIVKLKEGFAGLGSSIGKFFSKGKGGKGIMGKILPKMGTGGLVGGIGKAISGGAGGILKGLGRVAGKAFLPLQAAMSVYDGFKGFSADPTASLGDKLKNAGNSMLDGLTFGLFGKSPEEIQAESSSNKVNTPDTPAIIAKQLNTPTPESITRERETNTAVDNNTLLKELLAVVKQGGDVVMDGRKVGTTLQLASYKL